MDGIEQAAIRARARELTDRLDKDGLIQERTCANGHTGVIPTEYGWFAFSILKTWFAAADGAKWPDEVRFHEDCPYCSSEGVSSPGKPLPNG